MNTLLIVILVLLLVGAIPAHGWNPHLGYGMGGVGAALLIVLLVLILTGRL